MAAFKAAVKEGKVGALMNSYNLLNGIHATQNSHLNNDILKGQWKFDGFVMSDWGSTYDGLAAARGGLDLEMPSAAFMTSSNLQYYLNNGSITEETINDKVRRILRIIFRFGFYDQVQTISSIPLDNPDNATVALNVARSGIVLLKNSDSLLPLSRNKVKTLAVIGPNADQYVAGGGSSYTSPFHSVTILKGIQNLAGSNVSLKFEPGIPSVSDIAANSKFFVANGSSTQGLYGEYFNNQYLTNPVTNYRTDTAIDFHWSGAPNIQGIAADHFSIRWTGVVRPESSGEYEFVVAGDDGFRLWVNGQLVIDNWFDEAVTTRKTNVVLNAGQDYPVKLEYYENGGMAEITFGYRKSGSDYTNAVTAATDADAAVICVGFNSNLEGEGFDRGFPLPTGQDSLISAVSKANPNTIVVINAGGNVAMSSWINKVKGVIQAWYPGQEGGTAVAEILFGDINPSGKLPVSFEKRWLDNPTYNNYYSTNKNVNYSEGVFLGYRYFDSATTKPLFPFGFGLSYTSFEYSNLSIAEDSTDGKMKYLVTADIRNVGTMAGAEVVQLYVRDIESSVPRPTKELKAFTKVNLAPGETKKVTMVLNMDAFAYYSITKSSFTVDKGDFEIMVGSSSQEIKLTGNITIASDYLVVGVTENNINQDDFKIFPMPASNVLNFNIPNSKSNTIVEIYDLIGQKVDRFRLYGNNESHDCSNLMDGLYICRFITSNATCTKTIVIRK